MADEQKAKIYQFGDFHKPTRALVVQPEPFVLPQLYRLTGYQPQASSFDAPFPIASKLKAEPSYTLYNDVTEYTKIVDPVWVPIQRLDPRFDKGWVIIRQHLTIEAALGYMDTIVDQIGNKGIANCAMFLRPGIFTLLHRKKIIGVPDCLTIYIRKKKGTTTDKMVEVMWYADEYLIRYPNGTETGDPNVLFPFLKNQ